MRYRMLDILVCPKCRVASGISKRLNLDVFIEQKNIANNIDKIKKRCKTCYFKSKKTCSSCYQHDVVEGILTCSECNEKYPIINSIPRMLFGSLKKNMLKKYMSFVKKYHKKIDLESIEFSGDSTSKVKKKTMDSFGYQWQEYDEMYNEYRNYFLDYLYPYEPSFFKNKLVLDAGCGFGRFVYQSTDFGAETIGIDLSEAVESANKINKSPFSHIVQGDLYSLPFTKCFDFIYCLGVLQHIPERERGFNSLAQQLKKGSTLFVWVYGKRYDIYRVIDFMRPATTRMPFWMLNPICYFMSGIQEVFFTSPSRVLSKFKLTRKLSKKIPYNRYASYPFRHAVADWFDRLSVPLTYYFSKSEIQNMFLNNNFKEYTVIPRGYGWRGFAKR